jgi:hypothetical protein
VVVLSGLAQPLLSATGQALLLAEDIAAAAKPTRTSLIVPAGGPATRAGHLANGQSKAYVTKVAAVRRPVARALGTRPGEIAWLAVLLASACGFALYFGQELTGGHAPVRHRSRRRA